MLRQGHTWPPTHLGGSSVSIVFANRRHNRAPSSANPERRTKVHSTFVIRLNDSACCGSPCHALFLIFSTSTYLFKTPCDTSEQKGFPDFKSQSSFNTVWFRSFTPKVCPSLILPLRRASPLISHSSSLSLTWTAFLETEDIYTWPSIPTPSIPP